MTENPGIKEDDYLVRVKAQVMTRDDSTGGWVPMGGGGMSVVGLRKLLVTTLNNDDIRHEYLIHGQRIADQSVVLNCVLRKDVQYHKANPTFHHWKTEEKRFGLTFQSSADARAFDKGVKRAVEDLLEGSSDSNANEIEVGEDEVFMAVDLPLGRKDSSSQSASTASTTTSSPTPQSPALPSIQDPFCTTPGGHPHFHRVHYIPRHPKQTSPQSSDKGSTKSSNDSHGKEEVWVKVDRERNGSRIEMDPGSASMIEDKIAMAENYSYVQFARNNRHSVHEYSYPTLDPISKSPHRTSSINSLKKHNIDLMASQPPLPVKSKKKKKVPTATLR